MKKAIHPSLLATLLLALLWAAPPLVALDLYSGEAPILDESEGGKANAIQAAFRDMLVKVVGVRDRANAPQLAAEVARAQDYMVSYGFREIDSQGIRARRIVVSFDRERVASMLGGHGIPVWRVGRPEVVTWVVLDEDGQRRLLRPDQDGRLLGVLREAAEARGLALVFPLMDLEDRARLDADDVWRGISPALRTATGRYGDDSLMVARLTHAGGDIWSASWTLSVDAVQEQWRHSADGLREVARDAADRAVEALAARFAPPAMAGADDGGRSEVTLRVEEIRGRRDFARVNRLLPRMGSVVEAVIQVAEPEAAVFRLVVRGGAAALREELRRSGILQPAAGGGADELRYRLSY